MPNDEVDGEVVDTSIVPVFEEFKYESGMFEKEEYSLNRLSAAGVYTLMDKESKNLVKYFQDYGTEDYIKLGMGETFDTYEDLKPYDFTKAIREYQGTQGVRESSLFESNEDFVLVLDYEIRSNGTLCANFSNDYGFKLVAKNGVQSLVLGTKTCSLGPISDGREVLVIVHKRESEDKSSMKCYFSDKKRNIKSEGVKDLNFIKLPSDVAPLTFGGEYVNQSVGNNCAGIIYRARKFTGLLSEKECKKLVAWPCEQIEMFPCFINENETT
jgi:hypothetical protein